MEASATASRETLEPSDPGERSAFVAACDRLVSNERFQLLIIVVIVMNAVALGLGTFSGIEQQIGDDLLLFDAVCLGIYVVELTLRFIATGASPRRFFSNGWNVFDFVIIATAFIPGLNSASVVFRMARLLRVARLLRFLPEIKVLMRGFLAAIKPLFGLVVLTMLLLFLYGMLGWNLFHEVDPERWNNIGRSMLTLFTVLTLEGWPDTMQPCLEYSPWSALFFVSFVLIATFVVFNMVIGVIINSLDETRKAEEAIARQKALAEDGRLISDGHVVSRIEAVRQAIDDLELQLADITARKSERRGRGG